MARVRVEFSQSALDDLLGILQWYASQSVPEVGRRQVAAVIDHVEQAAAFPDSGRVVPEFDTLWLRELDLPPYRIVYRRGEELVTIVRVWRSERLMGEEPS